MIASRPLLVALQVFLLLGFLLLSAVGVAGLAGRKGKIQGESHVYLRSGPDLSYSPVAVLREGDDVTVEQEVKNWYRVSLADGQRGYVHKTLVNFVHYSMVAESREEEKAIPEPPPSEPPPQASAPKAKPSEVPRLFQHEGWELIQYVGGAVCVFLLGWIFGGNYYLRRDRVRTSKLRL